MDHAPIYRSAKNSRPAPLTSVVRGGSLVSAAVALTISGIALGYHGVAAPATETPGTGDARQASIDVLLPMVAFPRVDNGHPDLIAEISSAIVHNIQPTLPPVPIAPALPVFGPLVVVEAPPAFTDPVMVQVQILPVVDATLTPVDDSLVVDTAQLSGARAAVARTFAAAQVVDVAGVQEAASAPVTEVEPPAEAPAPAPTPAPVVQRPIPPAPVHVSTPESVRRVVVAPEPKPRVEEVKPAQVEAPKRTEPQKPEEQKEGAKNTTTNQKRDDDGHAKNHG